MAQRKLYNHFIYTDVFGIRTKIKQFKKKSNDIQGLEELMANQIADELYKEAQQTHDKVEELKKKYKL